MRILDRRQLLRTLAGTLALASVRAVHGLTSKTLTKPGKETHMRTLTARPLRRIDVGEVQLATRLHPGTGVPIVFIHGSFDDHYAWDALCASLPAAVQQPLLLFDRRGHGASTDQPGQGRLSDDVADVAALIRTIAGGSAHVVGHSYGANVAFALASGQPELVASLVLYEPPLFGLLAPVDEYAAARESAKQNMQRAASLLAAGEIEQGTVMFVESVAFGAGSWAAFDARTRASMLVNADTWLDQSRDPERLNVDVAGLDSFSRAMTLVGGSDSLPMFRGTNEQIRARLGALRYAQIAGAGHGGIGTHAAALGEVLNAHLAVAVR